MMELDRRERMKCVALAVYLSWVLLFTDSVRAEKPETLNIDCGATSTYVDDNGLKYVPDTEFIEIGTICNVSSIPNDTYVRRSFWNLRKFAKYKRNCYRLKSVTGSTYLIQVRYFYGNYDGFNSPPQFDLYIGAVYVSTVNLGHDTNIYGTYSEVITVATSDLLLVCLINTGKGNPIISEIRLVTLPKELYGKLTSSGSLSRYERRNLGTSHTVSYPDDIYGRKWGGWRCSRYGSINTTDEFISSDNSNPPSKVLQFATVPKDNRDSFSLAWPEFKKCDTSSLMWSDFNGLNNSMYHIVLYFAELEKLTENESREFNIYHQERLLHGPVRPKYLSVTTLYTEDPLEGNNLNFTFTKTTNSTHPPLLNALELFVLRKFNGSTTNRQDVEAIMGIKDTYQIKKNWMGDPCLPKDYPWSGLTCTEKDSYQITALDLSNSELKGNISHYLINMSSIEHIDLSNNNLTGSIPEFLAQLTSLKVLNLSNNKLSGYVPNSLQERMRRNELQMSIENNSDLVSTTDENPPTYPPLAPRYSYSSRKTRNLLLTVVIATFIVLAVFIILCIYKRRKGKKSLPLQERNTINLEFVKQGPENRKYSYKEVLRITNNFENITGKGGYGTVFSGYLQNGKKVAVKTLSETSAQGFKEFSAEIYLLMNIHHRNLVSLVGYCHEDTNMVLIYEYMDRGNLQNFLSSGSNVKNAFSWEQRVRIALDAAQGIEYLHHGCQPPIIHRDIKSANILLNERLEAKIADFGLSKSYPVNDLSHITTGVMGTPGYIDPEYYILNQLNEKSDVYSFGIVLLELATGEPPLIKASERIHIVQRVNSILEKGEIREVIDSRLEGDLDIHSVRKFVEIALECTSPGSAKRPSMSQVVTDLKECLKQETPKYTQRFENEIDSNISSIQCLETLPLAR